MKTIGDQKQYFVWLRRQWRSYHDSRKQLKQMFRETLKEGFRHPESIRDNQNTAIEKIDIPATVEYIQEHSPDKMMDIHIDKNKPGKERKI